jgi:probable rRNA maturation factor
MTVAADIAVEADCWDAQPDAQAIVTRAIAAADAGADDAQIAIVLTDDATIRALNARWRGQDKPTNVLSFPAPALRAPGEPLHLGDIVIAYETTAREAAEEGKPFAHHLSHLAVHGLLHLLGHDHGEDREADAMENLERTILSRLGIPDPYALRDSEALHA